jgi:hypothetical protein
MVAAVVTPFYTLRAIRNKKATLPTGMDFKTIDLDTSTKQIAAGIGGTVLAVYGVLNSIARWRTAADAATQEKINRGDITAADAPVASSKLDVTLTRANAGIAMATSIAAAGVAANKFRKPETSAQEKLESAAGAVLVTGVTAVISASKWKAANAAQRRLEEQEKSPASSHAARVEKEQSARTHDSFSR